jgi:hypothetical protein
MLGVDNVQDMVLVKIFSLLLRMEYKKCLAVETFFAGRRKKGVSGFHRQR